MYLRIPPNEQYNETGNEYAFINTVFKYSQCIYFKHVLN